MKIIMSPDELVEFIQSGMLPDSVKEQIVGGILAMCNSKEMNEAIKARVASSVTEALNAAILVDTKAWGGPRMVGWARTIIENSYRDKLKEFDIKDAILAMVQDEVQRQLGPLLDERIKNAVRAEALESITKRVEAMDLKGTIRKNIGEVITGICTDK